MRRPRGHHILGLSGALGIAAALVFACSSSSQSDPPPIDNTAPPPRAEASAPDVADAAMPDSAPSGPYCTTIDAASVVLCDDFETATAPLFGFDESALVADGGSSLTIAQGTGTTDPTNVLDVKLTQKADAGQSAFLTKNLPDSGAPDSFLHYEVELDVRVVGTASLAYVALGGLEFPAGLIKEHGFAVYDGNVYGRLVPKDFAVKDDKNLWHHVKIVLDRPQGSTVSSFATTIAIDGTLVDNVGGVDPGASGGSKVRIGAFATTPTVAGSIDAQFDNVVIRRW